MRCKRHTVDSSSTIGVCASCLRERLFSLAASTAASENNDHPYVADHKSSDTGGDSLAFRNSKTFATTQVDSTGGGGSSSSSSEKIFETNRSFKKKQTGLSRFSTFFTTRSNASTFSPPSSSWFSKALSRKQSTCYIEDLIASESSHHHQQRPRRRYCKGMSPANGLESVDDSPGRARRTPAMTGTPGRRKTTTMALCLSPLVRAKPNNNCSFAYTGELKSPVKPSFCSNRSKKLADFR